MAYKWGGKCGISLIPPTLLVTRVNKKKKKKKRPLKNGGNRMAHPYSKLREILIANKKIKELESRVAKGIQVAADLIKENYKLEKKLEETKKQRDCWRKLYRKIRPDEKVPCDRQKAMIEYGELDISEVLHR